MKPSSHLHPQWEEVSARAATDAAFRRALLADPVRALRDTLGIALPPAFRVRFVERPAELDALVVLPDLRAECDELTEEEMEAAAGGIDEWGTEPPPPPPPPPTT